MSSERTRPFTRAEAMKSAQKFVDEHFQNRNKEYPHMQIPASRDDDDLFLIDYLLETSEPVASPAPMTRERLSQEEFKQLYDRMYEGFASHMSASTYVREWVEDTLTTRVTAARLAEAAAENQACLVIADETIGEEFRKGHESPDGLRCEIVAKYVRRAIRSRMTPAHVSALDEVKRLSALAALEDYQKACILEDEGNCVDSMFGENELKRRIKALSAAVPDGAVKGNGDA